MAEITLSSAVRSNLLSLQNTAQLLSKTQERLATGLKVNSALDDPNAFFTASSLNSRSSDLNRLLDSVGLAVQTVEAADNGISSITKLVENAQATARQALQSPAAAATAATVTGTGTITDDTAAVATGAIGAGTLELGTGIGLAEGETLSITVGTQSFTFEFDTDASVTAGNTLVDISAGQTVDDLISALDTALTGVANVTDGTGDQISITAVDNGVDVNLQGTAGVLANLALDAVGTGPTANNRTVEPTNADLTALAGQNLAITVGTNTTLTVTFGTDDSAGEVDNIQELNTALGTLTGGTASFDGTLGVLTVTAANTTDSVTTLASNAAVNTAFGITDSTTAPVAGTNATRTALETQFNTLRTQIDQLASDAGFNGVNLLAGDNLSVIFNEDGSSSLAISGVNFNSTGLGISAVTAGDFQADAGIDAALTELDTAISTLRSQAATFGSNLSVVEVRQDFTKNLINTLESGAAGLTLADSNEEGANTLALQTRQQLSSVALSLASQADQQVLRLF